LNHTLTHKYAQRLDRAVIGVCVLADLGYATRIDQVLVLSLAVVSFLYGKWGQNVFAHALAHVLVTLNHGVGYY
jgi:hypothetical protein